MDFDKINGSSTSTSLGGEAMTYLRGILNPALYRQLMVLDGVMLKDLYIPPNARRTRLGAYYDRLLEKEGLTMDTNLAGIPKKLLTAIEGVRDEYMDDKGREPTWEEIEDLLYERKIITSKYRYEDIRGAALAGNIALGGLMEHIVDDDPSQDEDTNTSLATISLRQAIEGAFGELDEPEREVLKLRFGYPGLEPLSLEEVGERLNRTRERIRQIEARALAKLRHPQASDLLRAWHREYDDTFVPHERINYGSIVDADKFIRWLAYTYGDSNHTLAVAKKIGMRNQYIRYMNHDWLPGEVHHSWFKSSFDDKERLRTKNQAEVERARPYYEHREDLLKSLGYWLLENYGPNNEYASRIVWRDDMIGDLKIAINSLFVDNEIKDWDYRKAVLEDFAASFWKPGAYDRTQTELRTLFNLPANAESIEPNKEALVEAIMTQIKRALDERRANDEIQNSLTTTNDMVE
jgi:RNA polymerase primary sigma factor